MSRHWLRQQERGSRFTLKLITWIALKVGRQPARALLYPICLYFLLFSRHARRASQQYLEVILNRPARLREVFRHYHCFAATILDRVFLLSGRHDIFDLRIIGLRPLLERVGKGRGCILLGSHLGSFEVLRSVGVALGDLPVDAPGANDLKKNLPISILMYEEQARKINELITSLNPGMADTVIAIGGPDSMLRVKDRLEQGRLIGILGDRLAQSDKIVHCRFLGQPSIFPAGPMLMAAALKVPVILVFGLYRGGNRYDMYSELLADRIDISPSRRDEDLAMWTQRYVDRLEHYCRLAPYNWFNFYDFWATTTRPAP